MVSYISATILNSKRDILSYKVPMIGVSLQDVLFMAWGCFAYALRTITRTIIQCKCVSEKNLRRYFFSNHSCSFMMISTDFIYWFVFI